MPKRLRTDDSDILNLTEIVGGDSAILYRKEELIAHSCGGFTWDKHLPKAVVFPKDSEQVSQLVKYCNEQQLPFTSCCTGIELCMEVIPINGEVIISLARMNRLLSIDLENRLAVVEPGFINVKPDNSIVDDGCCYASIPTGQTCSLIGKTAENTNRVQCLKYEVSMNQVLGLEVVLADGKIIEIGTRGILDTPGYDLLGLIIGSEGTLGIVTKMTVRISRTPEAKETIFAYFEKVKDASKAMSDIVAAGIVPAALEMVDITAIRGAESSVFPINHPKNVEVVLLIEVEGIAAGLPEQAQKIFEICKERNAFEVKATRDEHEKKTWCANCKNGFGAMVAISPDYLVADGVIPRSKLPMVLRKIKEISVRYELNIVNIFHAEAGYLHSFVLFDAKKSGEKDKALAARSACLKACVEAGGFVIGENRVGVENTEELCQILTEKELQAQTDIRAFFNPDNLLKSGKAIPAQS